MGIGGRVQSRRGRGNHWSISGLVCRRSGQKSGSCANVGAAVGGAHRCYALDRRRSVLRNLSGEAGLKMGSHRSFAGGTMTAVELTSAVGLALNTVREHKMRSFLTVLGVIIGTGTIIGVGSIIAGLDSAITNVIRSFGTSTAIIFKFPIGFTHVTADEVRRQPLQHEDGAAIAERCPSVRVVSPYLFPNTFGTGPQINLAR